MVFYSQTKRNNRILIQKRNWTYTFCAITIKLLNVDT